VSRVDSSQRGGAADGGDVVTAMRSWAGSMLWPLKAAALLAHLGLGVLAVVKCARLDSVGAVPPRSHRGHLDRRQRRVVGGPRGACAVAAGARAGLAQSAQHPSIHVWAAEQTVTTGA
jgi:hypothetical protein